MDEQYLTDNIDLIREVFQYTHRFTGTTFVVKINYKLFDHIYFPLLVKDLATLHKAGIRIVLVPGATERIDEILKQFQMDTDRVNNIRISTQESIPFIKMAAFDVSNRLMTMLAGHSVTAVTGNWVRARGLGVQGGMDYQFSGRVERIDAAPIHTVLDEGFIPIFPCIGWNSKGQPYNISSNELAMQVALNLQAEKLFFLTNYSPFQTDSYNVQNLSLVVNENRISRMTIEEARAFITQNMDNSEDLSMLDLAAQACEGGISRVHILDGQIQGVLLKEIFSNQGIGTMVHQDPFESIRPMLPEDVSEVLRMMKPFVDQGILVPRSEKDMFQRIKDFVVYAVDGAIHGCGALHLYGTKGEIAAIAVDPGFRHLGLGQKIVAYLIHKAKELGLDEVFLLTTQTSDWFINLGFELGSVKDLPEPKRSHYNPGRKSRIYSKVLNHK
ncbi:amino-acid N-acetyltransferase [Spirochaeta cellobiosiphila]|uniref:amino-acid N-acetyltransferase n=1 Tax=Spirochaeta cellobiosiphila TaxID=504483 RepID=UPI0004145469|nr:amino-acid N-acetyltransferase [Spirochaeta cellobiosiphila]